MAPKGLEQYRRLRQSFKRPKATEVVQKVSQATEEIASSSDRLPNPAQSEILVAVTTPTPLKYHEAASSLLIAPHPEDFQKWSQSNVPVSNSSGSSAKDIEDVIGARMVWFNATICCLLFSYQR
jgi:hypothetical protein